MAAYETTLATVKEERKGGGELNLPLVQRMQSKKKKINTLKETLWDIEESLLPALLRVQNCDAKSVLNDRLHYSHKRGHQLKDSQVGSLVPKLRYEHTLTPLTESPRPN